MVLTDGVGRVDGGDGESRRYGAQEHDGVLRSVRTVYRWKTSHAGHHRGNNDFIR